MVLSHNYCCGPCFFILRKLYVESALRTNHYKTLGLSPSATQSEIKSAYYELSKKHHPDRNQGSEKSAVMFRNISEAYEVLGNEKERKKYDEGHPFKVVDKSDIFDTASMRDYNDEVERMYYERRQKQFSRRYYGRTPYYNFDEWFRAHYGKNSQFNADSWIKETFRKNSNYEFKQWRNSQEERKQHFKSYKSGTYRSYKESTDAMKKQELFFQKSEKIIILILYGAIICVLIMRF